MAGRAGASRAQRGVASCGLHSGFLRLFKGLKAICCIVADDEYLCSWPVGVRDGAALWQTVQLFIKKLNAELLPDLAIPPLRASPRETETETNGPRCAPGRGCTAAPERKHPTCPSVGEGTPMCPSTRGAPLGHGKEGGSDTRHAVDGP